MALLLRKRLIVIETESSYGTDPTPDGADAVLVRDLSITPQSSDVVSRDLIRPYLGASQQLLANTRVECTFSVELLVPERQEPLLSTARPSKPAAFLKLWSPTLPSSTSQLAQASLQSPSTTTLMVFATR